MPTLEPRAHVLRQIFPVPPVRGEESRIGQAVLAMMLFASSGFDHVADAGNSHRRCRRGARRRGDRRGHRQRSRARGVDEARRRRSIQFFRSPTRGAGVGVTGLFGVARSVAVTLGGAVSLAPRPGGGAVITMALPVAAESHFAVLVLAPGRSSTSTSTSTSPRPAPPPTSQPPWCSPPSGRWMIGQRGGSVGGGSGSRSRPSVKRTASNTSCTLSAGSSPVLSPRWIDWSPPAANAKSPSACQPSAAD